MFALANPNRFQKLAKQILPWAAGITVVSMGAGLVLGLFFAPPDYQQGESVRIMYVHVPSAWMALAIYTTIAVASGFFLVWKVPLADVLARAAAPIGAGFTLVTLVTGSLWGKPTWGTWWVWDARLTSVLILFFLYLGYIALQNAFEDSSRSAKAAAVLALIGFVNVPIIKWSVDWWHTLHQPASVVRFDGPTIHASMLTPLLLMTVGFTAFFVVLLLIRVRSALLVRKIRTLRLVQAGTDPHIGEA